MTRTVVFANNKGGVGKSTISCNLAAVTARLLPDKRILYIDLTLTESISKILLGDATPASMSKVLGLLSEVRTRRATAKTTALFSKFLEVPLRENEFGKVLLCRAALSAAFDHVSRFVYTQRSRRVATGGPLRVFALAARYRRVASHTPSA